MEDNSISIIVPVYNVEKYLCKSIDSIINQTYKNIEIILVNDGSTDSSGEICDSYKARYENVKVVHKQNAGLGYARNTGIDMASGKYILFVDSDDWISSDMVEKMATCAIEHYADMVICGFNRYYSDKNVLESKPVNKLTKYNGEEIISKVLLPIISSDSRQKDDSGREACVWTNLYKKQLIDSKNLRFVSEREYLSEDIIFNFDYILACQKVIMIPEPLYYYRKNNVSLSHSYRADRYYSSCMMINLLNQKVNEYNLNNVMEYRLERLFISKTRRNLFLAVNSKLRFNEKLKEVDKILNDKHLIEMISRYPIKNFALKHRISALLMSYKAKYLVTIYFWLQCVLKRK